MKILVADDETTSRLVLAATLRRLGHEVTAVEDGLAAFEAWSAGDYPLVVSDWLMPGLDGPALCRAIRSEPRSHYTYLLLLTSLEGKGNYLAGMEAGADDFVSKPFDPDLLAARINVAERMLSLHEALRIEATRDRLTGLLNRGAVLDALHQELHRAARGSGTTGLLLLDIDHFKRVNDTHGHLVGDAVLQEVAQRLRTTLRPYDAVGRFGGEEFVVVVPGSDASQAVVIAERIRQAIGAEPFSTGDGATLEVTVSIGAAIGPATPEDPVALLRAADQALYLAKANGRNRTELGTWEPVG